jgi:cysteine desulfurase
MTCEQVKGRRTVYLDFAATTPLDPEVLEAMLPWLRDDYGNPSSVHAAGRRARAAVEEARERVAALLGAHASEIIFTSGGTEANNLALTGSSSPGSMIVTARTEHEAVLRPVARLAKTGCRASYVPVRADGTVDPAELAELLRSAESQGAIVSLMHVNNETGAVNDVGALAEVAHEAGAIMHSDAVQSVALLDVRTDQLDVDLLSLSAHKLYGPKGMGALFVRSGSVVMAQLLGGPQERNRRAGTENVAGIVGLAKALEKAVFHRTNRRDAITRLRDNLINALDAELGDGILLNTPVAEGRAAPHIVNVSVLNDGHFEPDGEMLLLSLDLAGVQASSGSACSSGTVRPSHVLEAMGRTTSESSASVRFSVGAPTTESDVDYAVDCLADSVRRMKGLGRADQDRSRRT